MMSEIVRRPSEQCSPKTSPRGNRSPVVIPRQDSTGTLKTTISLGKTPAIVHSGPFYLMKELPHPSELTGATNLLQYHNLEHSFNKFCGRKIKDQLSAFLPNLPGNIDVPGSQDDSSLRKMIERPPITSIEIVPLNKQQLDSAFRLHIGPVPEQYRFMSQTVPKRKHKRKKTHKIRSGPNGPGDSPSFIQNDHHSAHLLSSDSNINSDILSSNRDRDSHEMMKKHKKQKRHDDEKEQRRKKKKDKKKKKRHSPDSPPYDTNSSIHMDDSPMMSTPSSSSLMIGGGPGTPSNPTLLNNNNNGLNSSSITTTTTSSSSSNHQLSNQLQSLPSSSSLTSSNTSLQHQQQHSNHNLNGTSSSSSSMIGGRPLL